MQAATINDVSSQGQYLRYLTAHFRDLQGLRMVPLWASLLVLTSLAKTGSFSRGHLAWAAFACVAAEFGWLHLIGGWYGRRYGIVEEPDVAVPSGLISILNPQVTPRRADNRRYGYLSDASAVLSLIYALALVPEIFLGHNAQPGTLALLVMVYHVLPRCLYPVPRDGSVLLRRLFAMTAVIAMIGTFICYRFDQMVLRTCVTVLLSLLLLLDLYDHWLLNHLLDRDFTGQSYEE